MSSKLFLLVLFVLSVVAVLTLSSKERFSNYEVFCAPRIEQLRIPFIYDICNSAPPPNSTVWFNVDILDTLNGQPVESNVILWYSFDNQTSWNSNSMMPIDTIGFKITYETDIVSPSSGTVYYFIRTQNDSGYYGTQSPINIDNIFPTPSNLLISTCDEEVGDTTGGAAGPWLDLTGCWAGYSQDSLYIMITNNGGGWPWYESYLFGPWFIYGGGVYNPEAPSDSFAYTLGRIDSPIMTSCLLKINQYTGDFWTIGDIDETTNGDTLWIRCALADLVNDPDFGPWPNSSGIYLSGGTMTLYVSGSLELNDFTDTGRFYLETPTFIIGSNSSPLLTNPQVQPDSGTPDTTFTFTVTYTDTDNNLPTLKNVVIDGMDYQMSSDDHSYSDGAEFSFSKDSFSVGKHNFYFEFSDGMDTVNTNSDTFVVYEAGVGKKREPAYKMKDSKFLSIYPNPFTTSIAITISRVSESELKIYDVAGRLVKDLSLTTNHSALTTAVSWDGRDDGGKTLPGGIYFCKLKTDKKIVTRKILCVR
jgi:hypothetical protein